MADCWQHKLGSMQAAQIANVTFRQMDHWLRTGLLPAPAKPARGRGTAREFSYLDIVRLRIAGQLRQEGLSLTAIRKALSAVDTAWNERDPAATGRLIAIDGQVCLEADSELLWDILAQRNTARRIVVVDVGELAKETKQQIELLCDSAA